MLKKLAIVAIAFHKLIILKNYKRSTKSHEAARKESLVRVISGSFVGRHLLR
jgi:hypothetical protein